MKHKSQTSARVRIERADKIVATIRQSMLSDGIENRDLNLKLDETFRSIDLAKINLVVFGDDWDLRRAVALIDICVQSLMRESSFRRALYSTPNLYDINEKMQRTLLECGSLQPELRNHLDQIIEVFLVCWTPVGGLTEPGFDELRFQKLIQESQLRAMSERSISVYSFILSHALHCESSMKRLPLANPRKSVGEILCYGLINYFTRDFALLGSRVRCSHCRKIVGPKKRRGAKYCDEECKNAFHSTSQVKL